MTLQEKITHLAQESLFSESQFLVDVVVSAHKGPVKVTVILDGEPGVTIEDCARVSRQLLDKLEEQGLVEDNFTLEVTTPGLDQPLKLKRQYFKNIGRRLKVHLSDKSIVEGTLREVTEEKIFLGEEAKAGKKKDLKKKEVLFSEIAKAFVQISFK